jgi:hypothetical protein
MADSQHDGFRDRPLWLLAVAALVLAQAGLALALFGPGRAWSAVTDDRPVLSGRHPLHLYHGVLGAATFLDRGTTTCYDPAFQAGYPKTPVFDGGCRPAELFLTLSGGRYSPAAYKLGLLTLLLLVPIAFTAAARGAGLPAGAAVLVGAVGILLSWSPPVRQMIAEGDLDLIASGLAGIVFVPWLARFARTMGVDTWLVLAGCALLGWYFHPLVWLGLSPVVLAYYLVYAPRHGPAWHLGLIAITFAGVLPNVWWLADWGKYWWLRQPAQGDAIPLPDWQAALGTPADYVALVRVLPAGAVLVLGGLAGLAVMWRSGHRAAAWLSLLAAVLAVAGARVAWAWPATPPGVAQRAVVLAGGFLITPAVFGLWTLLDRLRVARVTAIVAVGALVVIGWADGANRRLARAAGVAAEPLPIGLTDEQRDLVTLLKQHTTQEARILWDETKEARARWNWSALLPLLTDRAYLGGLDPEAGVEHSHCAMCSRQLTGRKLAEWPDDELAAFCRWYNVGWVVARSPEVIARWSRYPAARVVARVTEGGRPVVLYALERPRSFVLAGSATWESADTRRVVLTNVTPSAEGEVHLSLHMQDGLRVSPSYVQIEKLEDPAIHDPIPVVRLRMPGPVPRITLTWEAP